MVTGKDGKERVKKFKMKNTLFLPATPLGGGAFAALYCSGISADMNENISTLKTLKGQFYKKCTLFPRYFLCMS
jgi:hypothetical protein